MSRQPESSNSDGHSRLDILECPIDSMLLIHKSLRSEAAKIEEMVRSLQKGASLQTVRPAFNPWASVSVFHAEQEDEHMTGQMADFQPARDNEAEHSGLLPILDDITAKLADNDPRGLAELVKDLVAACPEEQPSEMFQRLEAVMQVLDAEVGRARLVDRTHHHLYQSVVALRVAQDDHLECEEEFVLPTIRGIY